MIILTGDNLSITVSAVSEQITKNLKTSYNVSITSAQTGTSTLSISAMAVGKPSWPLLSGVSDIEIPLFGEVSSTDYPYKNYDSIKVNGTSASAFPAPNQIELSSIMDNKSYSAFGLSTNECLLYAFTNGMLNYISSAVSSSMYVGEFNQLVDFQNNLETASATFDIPPEKMTDPINFVGALYSVDSGIWKSANVILNKNNNQITIVIDNDINYNMPIHEVTTNSTYNGIATLTTDIDPVTLRQIVDLPPLIITTSVNHSYIYNGIPVSKNINFKLLIIKII
jgi:hypothetical protein